MAKYNLLAVEQRVVIEVEIVRSKKENCKTCVYKDENGALEPCNSCMMDKEDPDIRYYTGYKRDYELWPESEYEYTVAVPEFTKEDKDG